MVRSQKLIITLLFVLITAQSVSVCPSGSIDYNTLNLLTEDVLQWSSQNYDVFYRITYQTGNYLLNCYRLVDQSLSPTPTIQIQNFSTQASKSWEIKSVSQKGGCVAVQQDSNLTTYSTSSGQFTQVQSIDISKFGSDAEYSVNDDCSLIHVALKDGSGTISTKAYQNQVQMDSLILPQGSLLSSDFAYAIDTSSNFYQLSNDSYVSTTISQLKLIPVYIKWSSILKALITLTRDSTGYTLYVIDPSNKANFYSKTFLTGTDYTGDLTYNIKSSSGSILMKDINGFVSYIQLKLQNSLIVPYVYALQQSTYSSIFNSDGFASISSDIIFVYNNNQISYFQAYSSKIYYLGQLASDIAATGDNYRIEYSPQQISIVLALFSPTDLALCQPQGTTNSSSSSATTANTQQMSTASVVDSKTGLTLKCPDNCAACTSSESCSICRVGYSLNDQTGKCVFCNGCLTCSPLDPNVCYLCFATTILNKTTSTCDLPQCTISNCLICNATGQCTSCKAGYGLSNSQCQKCSVTGCRSCSASADSCDSNSCMLGYVYYLNPSTNKGVCQPCSSGCDICSTSDLSACSSCSAGYYAQADSSGINRCVTCFANCKECSSANVCTKCVTGYIPSADGSSCTLKCSDSCLTCDQSSASKCLSCYAGSVLNTTSNKCMVDMSCNATASCLICGDGYVLNAGNCLQCQTTDPNCLGCSSTDLTVCQQCNVGYYLKSNTCNKCTGNCDVCISQYSCAKCSDGYYLVALDASGTGNCQICDSSCLTCTSTSVICTSCVTGYVLQGSKCISINRVSMEFVIQANVNNFIEFMEDLLNWIVDQVNAGKTVGTDDITQQQVALLKTMKYGSSVVSSVISSNSADNTNGVASALNKAINSGPSIKGYQIISGSATAQITESPNTTPSTPISSSSSNIGIIVGIIVPLAIILIVVSGIIGYKIYKRKQNQKENEKAKQDAQRMDTDAERYSTKQMFNSNSRIEEKI